MVYGDISLQWKSWGVSIQKKEESVFAPAPDSKALANPASNNH